MLAGLAARAVIIGLAVGLVLSLRHVVAHGYPQHRMFRISFAYVQRALNTWIPLAVGSLVPLYLLWLPVGWICGRLVGKRLPLRLSPEQKDELPFVFMVCTTVFLLCGWIANTRWLPHKFHPTSLLGDAYILAGTLVLWWILVRAPWLNVFHYLRNAATLKVAGTVLVLILALNLGVLVDSTTNVPKSPNVIFILIDALRADHLSCCDYERDTSPFLSRELKNGVLFDNVISQSSWTKTSMPSMFTSKYPVIHKVRTPTDKFDERHVTLAEILKNNGYRTAGFQTNPWLTRHFGFGQGFSTYRFLDMKTKAGPLNENVFAWLDRNSDRRFFLYIHYMDVHEPYEPPGEFRTYGSKPVDLYDGEILYTDDALARLFARIRQLGIDDDTLIVIASDHGEEFQEHGGYSHGRTLYQEQLRVPLLLFGPQLAGHHGKRLGRRVANNDILPTILDILDIRAPKHLAMEGESLLGILNGAAPEDKHLFSAVGLNDCRPENDLTSVIAPDDMKYILYINVGNGTSREMLFNLAGDPGEQNNLSENDTNRDSLATLATIVRDEYLARAPASRSPGSVVIDEETRRRLKSLGYLR